MLALGRAITTDKPQDDAQVWFAAHSELFKRQGEFKGPHTGDTTSNETKEKATAIVAQVIAKQRPGSAEDHSAKVSEIFLNGSNG